MSSDSLQEHDLSLTLSDPALVFAAFMRCLQEGEHQEAQSILAAGLRHMNKARLAKRYGIARRSLYNLMDLRNSPKLELVAKVCRALRQEAAEKR